jgi:hypothetical protein
VTSDDANLFLSISLFRAMRDELHAPELPSADPLDVFEDFCKHTGLALDAGAAAVLCRRCLIVLAHGSARTLAAALE